MTDTTQNIKTQPRDSKGRVLAKPKDTPTLAILSTLNDIMMSIRAKHPEVPPTVLVVGAPGKRGNSMVHGHFAPKSWDSKVAQHEIMMSGESLKRGAVETLGTLLHESAHALAAARDIKDTSRQGRFHNKRFKALAEEVGIEVTNDKRIGWSPTTVPEATRALYKKELAELSKALKAYRLPVLKAAKPKTTIQLITEDGERKVTVPIRFFLAGNIIDQATGELFEPAEITPELIATAEKIGYPIPKSWRD